MKKLIAMLLALVMVFALVACGGTNDTPPAQDNTPAPAADDNKAPEAPAADNEPAAPAADDNSAEQPAESGERPVPDLVPGTVTLSDSKALEGKRIGCTIVYKGDEWCYQTALALETLGAYYGADITVEDGDIQDEVQVKQIENMIANGCDILMVDPTTPDGCHEALMKAVDAGIPIIIYDGYWSVGQENAVSTVTWDQHETGCIVARYLVDYVQKNMDGKCRVIEMANKISTHCQDRWVGFHEVVDEANANGCEITIVNPQQYDSQGNRELAYNAIAAVVEPYDIIVSDVDNGAMGSVAALQAAGNTSVKVFSMGAYGAEPFGALHDKDANYTACLNVDAWVLGQAVMQAALDYFEGKTPEKTINIDLFMVDADNVEEFWTF